MRAVRKFWLSLLLFVLPLQMSWAATHICLEPIKPAHGVTAAQVAEAHEAAASAEQDRNDAGKSTADVCCVAAHGCHGLHSMMGADAAVPQFLKQSQHAATPPPALCGFDAIARIDRPQWSAA